MVSCRWPIDTNHVSDTVVVKNTILTQRKVFCRSFSCLVLFVWQDVKFGSDKKALHRETEGFIPTRHSLTA